MQTAAAEKPRSKIGLILLAFVAFISLGLPDGLLGVGWPSIRHDFGLPLDSLGLLLAASMLGYLTSSFFGGKVMSRLGVGGLLAASCFATGAALLGYTLAPAWYVMVALGVVAGAGGGAIDAGINTYIASEHGEVLMQWLHASFGVGVTLGPVIMTSGLNLFNAWRPGYWLVGTAQVLLALCFALTAGLWKRTKKNAGEAEDQRLIDFHTPLLETLRHPATWISLLLFFFYTGGEITFGVWGYTLMTESRGIAPEIAGLLVGSYWAMFTIGRVVAGLYTRRAPIQSLLRAAILAALAGAVLLWWNPVNWAGLLGAVIIGFAIAPVFPGLVSGTSDRVSPRHAANTIGMQISAAGLGAAAVPGFAGVLARYTSLEAIPPFMVLIFLAIYLLYSVSKKG